jgi:hypothetical protein
VRLLSNLESSRHKLLQIVLFGQPELDEVLGKTSMRQLKDRITHSFRTRPLTADEVAKYVSFRMRAAGYKGPEVFTAPAINTISRASSGLTRRINVLCDKSLLAAFAANTHAVTPRQVRAAIADSDFAPVLGARRPLRPALAAAALLVLGAVAGASVLQWLDRREEARPAAARPPQKKAAPAAEVAATPPVATPEVLAATPKATPQAEPPKPPVHVVPTVAPAPTALLTAEQMRRLDGYGAGRNLLLRERLAATREKLAAAADTTYSIELFIADNSAPERAERFLLRARDLVPLPEVYVIPVAAGGAGRYRLRVTYGMFANRDAAAEAAKRLPPKYQNAFKFELRNLAELRAAI